MKIALCTQSKLKESAVKKVFGTVVTFKSESGIPEQPYHAGETFRGACKRIESIKTGSAGELDGYDYFIAIENGIVTFGTVFIDLAVIVAENVETGERETVTSMGLPVDHKLAFKSVFELNQEQTVGELMAEKFRSDSKDPHSFITKGEFAREKLLIDALSLLKSTLRPKVLKEILIAN